MKTVKLFSPDATPPTGGTPSTTGTSASNIPKKDIDFLATMEAVAAKWALNPSLTLLWVTQASFATTVQAYRTALTTRNSTGSNRPALTKALRTLDKKIDAAVTEVKVYIQKKFKKANAIPQFSRYGIIKQASAYQLPRDQNERLAALALMQAAITADGFDNEEYGKTFWAAITAEYKTTLDAANATDGTVSTNVATKNELRKQLNKVSVALLLLLKANYPDTYTGVYRDWGWKK